MALRRGQDVVGEIEKQVCEGSVVEFQSRMGTFDLRKALLVALLEHAREDLYG